MMMMMMMMMLTGHHYYYHHDLCHPHRGSYEGLGVIQGHWHLQFLLSGSTRKGRERGGVSWSRIYGIGGGESGGGEHEEN